MPNRIQALVVTSLLTAGIACGGTLADLAVSAQGAQPDGMQSAIAPSNAAPGEPGAVPSKPTAPQAVHDDQAAQLLGRYCKPLLQGGASKSEAEQQAARERDCLQDARNRRVLLST